MPPVRRVFNDKAFASRRLAPLLYLLAGGALLGLSTNLAKQAGEMALSPLAFLFWSLAGAALILLALAAGRGRLPPVNARTLEYYTVSALVGVAGSNLLFFSAIAHIGAGFVALIITLPPLLTYLGALALKIERFQPSRGLGVLTALAGALILAAHKIAAPQADVHWILLSLLGPVLLAIGNLYRTLRWPPGVAGETLAPGMLVAAVVLLLGVSLLPDFSLAVPQLRLELISLIGLQAVVFAGQFLLLFLLQKSGGPVLLSLLGSVGALFGVPVAIFIQGESAPEGLLLGGLLIAIGIALLNLDKVRQKT
ncbi:EamA family transporter [Halomonas sp. PAMB 3264]|uniref:EamA family transporter n=1 Tax=unclassified Halomonas TaxID=2609666 RepID=UPI0028A21C72|nr:MULTISPECIES: EamA family transporter [unclassified Halomonas]WNL39936.1 EamA family transporter [Halomonas sp. PAMB 3232]WNL43244.1 EamA family transporter [Halomonas sp. PAMB 3264]